MEASYPELKTRVQSIFIDGMFMLALMLLAASVLDKMNPTQEAEDGWIKGLIFIAIWGIYEPVAVSLGCTLGNYMMKIRVRDNLYRTKKINLLQSYMRFVVKILLGWISFLTIHSNKERRAIHDFASGSVMTEK